MAMLKQIKKSDSKKNVIFVPGGPGLGPISFIPMTEFICNSNVYYYFPSGCDDQSKTDIDYSYESQLKEFQDQIEKIDNVVLIGHSFGGILASDLVVNKPNLIKALVCIAAPFSEKVFAAASSAFRKIQSPESLLISKRFESNPTDENYKEWFSFYGELYFSEFNVNEGKKMILADSACAKSYLAARGESAKKEFLLSAIKNIEIEKLFILGNDDKLLPSRVLQEDAAAGNFKLKTINNAGHFVHFDKPKEVADVINAFINEMGE